MRKIKAIFLDCDGVLTTGSFFYTSQGKFAKEFSCLDGKGLSKAKKEGIKLLVITEEPDSAGFEITKKRCEDQRIDVVRADDPEDKLIIGKRYCKEWGIDLSECVFIADDIGDMFLLKEVGVPIVTSNATPKVKEFVKKRGGYITKLTGGHGAVREAIERILDNYVQEES